MDITSVKHISEYIEKFIDEMSPSIDTKNRKYPCSHFGDLNAYTTNEWTRKEYFKDLMGTSNLFSK